MPAETKKPETKKPAAKKPEAEAVVEEVVVEREVATEVVEAPSHLDVMQNKLVNSREYGDKVRRDSIARNRKRRDEAQKAQTLPA